MKQADEELFEDLIQASSILVTVTKNAATVLSEEFEDMVTGPAANVQAILDKCPEGGIAWDGTFNEDDVVEADWDTGYPDSQGLKLTHEPSGKSVVTTYPRGVSSIDKAVMYRVRSTALNTLQNIVTRYVVEQRKIGAL